MTSPILTQAETGSEPVPTPAAAPAPHWARQARALLARDFRAAVLNRFLQLLSAVSLAVGLAPLADEHPGETAPYFLVQAVLYLIPLFALLIGVGSAQGEIEERGFLLTQPVPRLAIALGKWVALWLPMALLSGLLALPSALFGGAAPGPLAWLWLGAVEMAGLFLALGMALGFSTEDRVKANLGALCLWVALIAGIDLFALGMVRAGWFFDTPALWLLLLMGNPFEAFRVGALFSLDQAPLDPAQIPPLGRWWLAHPQTWLVLLAAGWTVLALGWCWLRLRRMEA